MLRRRRSIRAFNDDRPISAYGALTKYWPPPPPAYGRSTRLWHRRWSAVAGRRVADESVDGVG